MNLTTPKPPRSLAIIASLMLLFGFAEIVAGFRHQFFGLTTSENTISTYAGAGIGALYFISGLLIFTWKKWAARLSVVLLITDIVGRVAMVFAGFYRPRFRFGRNFLEVYFQNDFSFYTLSSI